jgi:hypothetical protein
MKRVAAACCFDLHLRQGGVRLPLLDLVVLAIIDRERSGRFSLISSDLSEKEQNW